MNKIRIGQKVVDKRNNKKALIVDVVHYGTNSNILIEIIKDDSHTSCYYNIINFNDNFEFVNNKNFMV